MTNSKERLPLKDVSNQIGCQRDNGVKHPTMTKSKEGLPLKDVSNQIGCERGKDTDANSPLHTMHAVHLRLSQALKGVDGMMEIAHGLYCTNQLSSLETTNFTSAMTEMTECVEAWQGFFRTAVERSRALQHEDALIDLEADSLSCSGAGDSFQYDDMFISNSPLVPSKSRTLPLFPLTPLDRPSKACKQHAAAASGVHVKRPVRTNRSSSTLKHDAGPVVVNPTLALPISLKTQTVKSPDLDPLTFVAGSPPSMTPAMPSPPHARQIRPYSPRNRRSSVSTPLPQHRRLHSPESPESMELITPHPPEFLNKYPGLVGKIQLEPNAIPSTPMPETPNFWRSPPRTCRPLQLLEDGSFDGDSQSDIVTPNCSRSGPATSTGAQSGISTPYGTPDSVLRPLTPFSITRSSMPLVDDITASAIQRIGVKGLEDELWTKLKAWHIDTNLGGPYAKLRVSSGIPFPKHAGSQKNSDI